ncbi:hypothetical protein [Streptomyces sp. NBC_01500]|uniref:hypothetical protein n=1 Tax=Streptomyces sp. NBC_01500 TaxID=2903886 RepID=UPI002251D78B|nr:hypothetical protein [Streptomyces sp. NBC_01500]MCX4549037.1 hypothetical protein [Streptomyces sp. NBC_01500]
MGRPEDPAGETPEQLKKRAEDLRACARKARALANRLGPHLDGAAKKAQQSDPPIWQGPFATDSTRQIVNRSRTLGQMASALMHDAGRWGVEADRLDDQMKAALAKQKTGPGH